MDKPQRIHIYYDGNCPMCVAFADKVSTHSSETPTVLIDANLNLNETLDRETLLNEIHLFEADGTKRTGADAVLTALARVTPWLKPLSVLVRLPVFNWLAKQVYFFVSKRRKLWFGGETARLYWLFLITNLGLLLGIILSWPLWGTDRTYPTLPIFSQIEILTSYTYLFSIGLITALVATLFFVRKFNLISLISVIFLIPLLLLDITRLQPWVWHYLFLIFLFTWWKDNSTTNRTTNLLDAARIVVVGIYFWSGIQKMNVAFFLDTFSWFTEPLWSNFGAIGTYTAFSVGVFVPFIEAAFAIGLLTKRFRKISIIGSSLMLMLVILALVFGREWNSSVWPWNFAIFFMVLTLFYKSTDSFKDFIGRAHKNIFAILATLLFIVMPFGNIFGQVDHYLSWSLYSGHVPTAEIITSPEIIKLLAPNATTVIKNNQLTLSFVQWSISAFNAVPYPEERVFLGIFAKLCRERNEDQDLLLALKTRPFFASNLATTKYYNCASAAVNR